MKGSILGRCERRILWEHVAVAVFVKAGRVLRRGLGEVGVSLKPGCPWRNTDENFDGLIQNLFQDPSCGCTTDEPYTHTTNKRLKCMSVQRLKLFYIMCQSTGTPLGLRLLVKEIMTGALARSITIHSIKQDCTDEWVNSFDNWYMLENFWHTKHKSCISKAHVNTIRLETWQLQILTRQALFRDTNAFLKQQCFWIQHGFSPMMPYLDGKAIWHITFSLVHRFEASKQ